MNTENVLPKQVQEQSDNADKLWNEQHGKTEAAPKEDDEIKKEEERLAEEQAELERVEEEKKAQEEEDAAKAKQLEEEPDFKHKYDVLQGKYDAEIPRLTSDVQKLRSHNIELSQIISTLQSEVEKVKTTEKPKDISTVLTKEEMEDLESVIEPSLLNKVVDNLLAERLRKIEQSVSSVQNTQFQTAEDIFWGKIDSIPNWQAINNDPVFNEWLDNKAPYTHLTRRQLLKEAQSKLDAVTVAEIFTDFSGTKETPPETTKRKPRISPAKGTGRTITSAVGKQWAIKDINNFYNDVQKGKYKGREKERKQIEQDIWNAQKEGRIIK